MRLLDKNLQTVANTNEIKNLIKIVYKRYPAFDSLPAKERFLLVASVLVNDIQIREPGGPNKGAWQRIMGKFVGLSDGYAWCAIFVYFCASAAGLQFKGLVPRNAAAVRQFYKWAKKNGLLTKTPKRSDLALMLNANGTGHIGIITANVGSNDFTLTFEGNTSSGESGSQRDGDGAYRRTRKKSFWDFYIKVS